MSKIYQDIASALVAIRNCQKSGNVEWEARHAERIESLVRDYFPSGSGFNAGTQFDIADNVDDKRERLTFETSFHHMSETGFYDGWTEHKVIVTPCFAGINIRITGRNRNDIKDHIHDCFSSILMDSKDRIDAAFQARESAQ